jgi:hypothetical protein
VTNLTPTLVLDLAGTLTPSAIEQLGEQLREIEIWTLPTQFDTDISSVSQAVSLIDTVGLTPDEWKTRSIVVRLPNKPIAAVIIIAVLHSRMGHFPNVLTLVAQNGIRVGIIDLSEV